MSRNLVLYEVSTELDEECARAMASFEHGPDERPRARARLVPPARRTRGPKQADDDAQLWAQKLHHKRKRLVLIVGGNMLMLLLLVGGPFYRGQQRARASFAAHAEFSSCLFATPAQRPAGIGAAHDEPQRFAAQALAHDPRWPQRCMPALARIAPESALFVLPSVKSSEARVQEATRVLRNELGAMKQHRPGMRLPERPLRALAQLREQLEKQGDAAGLLEPPRHATLRTSRATLPAPAQLPLYVSREAVVTLWGDDHALHAVGVDQPGVSYLEVRPGHPLRRARLPRPSSLLAFLRREQRSLLVWATNEARCRERGVTGCHGKASGVALASLPLFTFPSARYVAAHLAARADRGLVLQAQRLYLVSTTANGSKAVESSWFGESMLADESLPPLSTAASFAGEHDDVLLVGAAARVWALASDEGVLSVLSASEAHPLVSFASPTVPWVTACAQGDEVHYAAGNGRSLVLGAVGGGEPRSFQPVPLAIDDVFDEHDARRDRVQTVCSGRAPLAFVRAADDALLAVHCALQGAACVVLPVASKVSAFAVVPTGAGALVAYAESAERPQIYVRELDLTERSLGPARAPAACWEGGRGMCGQPVLERLGARILLAAREGTDLVLLESGDEGKRWAAPPIY
nr:hypothetical protein [uncultured bacterium]